LIIKRLRQFWPHKEKVCLPSAYHFSGERVAAIKGATDPLLGGFCSSAVAVTGGMCRVIPRLIKIFAPVFFALSVMLAFAQKDSQAFRDLKAEVEQLQIDQMNREWHELDVQRKAEEAKQQAEMAAMSAYRQWTPPLAQPDDATDSLVRELRDLKDEIEQSRIDADFRQYQAALQARLDTMTPEQRAAYWESQRLALEKAKADAIQVEARKKTQEEEARCHDPFPYPPHKWDHRTEFGTTFAIIKFRELKAGDRKKELDGYTAAIGARFYKQWSRVKQGGTDWVEVVFYK